MKKSFKRVISLMTSVLMLLNVVLIGTATEAESNTGVIFYNAVNDEVITEVTGEESIYAEVAFSATKSGKASIIAARYDEKGTFLSVEVVNEIEAVTGKNEFKTPSINTGEENTLKLFVWDSMLFPFLDKPGEITNVGGEFVYVTKFADKGQTEYIRESVVELGDLFSEVLGVKPAIDGDKVSVAFETTDGNATATYAQNAEDWTKGTVKFDGVGAVTVTVTDSYYCIPTTIAINVNDFPSVDKFVAKSDLSFEHTKQGGTIEKTLGDIFEAKSDVSINSENVVVTVDNEICTYTENKEDWTQGTLTFEGTGEVNITITDNDYCNEATAKIEITEPDFVDKFIASDNLTFKHETQGETITKTLGELFMVVENADIDTAGITVEISGDEIYIYTEAENWAESTIDFTGTGAVSVKITDNNFCNEASATVIITEPENSEKFKANENLTFTHTEENGTINKTVGDIFTAVDGANIRTVEVTVDGNICTYQPNADDWKQGTLAFTGTGTVTFTITDNNFCTPTVATVTIAEPEETDKFTTKFKNTNYLYRVGNVNAVELGSLFEAIEGTDIGNVTATVVAVSGNATGTNVENVTDWENATIQLSGTGVASITIDDNKYAKKYTLTVEVVNAKNVTQYSELANANCVLLNDITMRSGSSYYLSGGNTLYGNGFTFDVSQGAYTGTKDVSSNYVVGLNNANLDNIKIVGAVYTEYGGTASGDYNRATVLINGDGISTISNSYISNCASPIRINKGDLEVVNTTLKGGNVANLDIRNGNIILDDVTTINQVNANDKAEDGTIVVGLGVLVWYEGVQNTTTIEVKNGITQYNHLSKEQAKQIDEDTIKSLINEMYSSSFSEFQYNSGNDIWVNTGILSTSGSVGDDNISNVAGYKGQDVETLYGSGYLHAKQPDATSIQESVPEYVTAGQGVIAPLYSFDYTSKNYTAKTDGSNDYCYYDNGTVLVSMDKGETFTWDTAILTATKSGQTIPYTVSMNGTDYTGKKITFDTAGDYVVKYTYTDNNNYSVDENGDVTTYPKTYEKNVHINVNIVQPTSKHAEFAFADTNTATEKVTVGNNTYIVPNGITTNSAEWGYITVSGQKIFYPITEANVTKNMLGKVAAYFNVFKDVVTITDYTDGGNGNEVVYNSTTTSMPSNLSVVKGYYGSYSSISNAVMDDSQLAQKGPENTFKYYASSEASTTPTTNSSALCYASPSNLNTSGRGESITVAQYKYVDNAGATYYYYVGYHMIDAAKASSGSSSGSGCLTDGTLITLADGSSKKVEEVTYEDELLVWNFCDGEYATVPATLIMNDGEKEYTVITLNFDDNTEIKLVDIHGLYDADLNEFVYIDPENVASYVGHNFVKTTMDKNGEVLNTTVKLTDYEVTKEYSGCYTIQSAYHVNCIANDLLTQTPPIAEGYFDYFEMGEGMQYDQNKMKADIEKYGLYTYEDFEQYLTYEAFMAFNGPYLKVAVGKGYFDYDFLIEQIKVFGVEK